MDNASHNLIARMMKSGHESNARRHYGDELVDEYLASLKKSPARDQIGREVVVTVLQGKSEWIGDWEILCVKQTDQPATCTLCDTEITSMDQVGAWKLHTGSLICTSCLKRHWAEDVDITTLPDERVNPRH